MSKEREQTTSSSGLPPSDDAMTAHKGVLQRLIDKFRGPQFALGYPPPDWLFLKEDEILRPAQKSLEELRIVVPPNISPERLVVEGCWGDSFPEVKLMRSERLKTMQLHDESTCSRASHDLIYGDPGGDPGLH